MATKTINLTGAEVAVTGLDGANAHIRNDGTEVIYAAKTAGITAGADGVLSIPAGQAATVYGISGTVYMLGTGSAQIISNDYSELPFKTSATSGGSGADEVARAAINAHSGNAEIHVTAEEKAAWNDKAELTDIPTTLPANGGNADTLDGKHAESFMQWLGAPFDTNFMNDASYKIDYHCNIGNGALIGLPIAGWYHIVYYMHSNFNGFGMQIAYPLNFDGTTYIRRAMDTTWGDWKNIADGGNADTLDGKHASDFALSTNPTIEGDIHIARSGNATRSSTLFAWGDTVRIRNAEIGAENTTYIELSITPNGIYVETVQDGTRISYTKINDGGNAASVGTYTEAKLTELEARIAALEGGTT